MRQLIRSLSARLAPWLQGFLGCLLALAIYLAVSWVSERYREFIVMRSVVGQIIQANQKASPPVSPPR